MSAIILKNHKFYKPFVFKNFNKPICESLKIARQMYVIHKTARTPATNYWANECLKLRVLLDG